MIKHDLSMRVFVILFCSLFFSASPSVAEESADAAFERVRRALWTEPARTQVETALTDLKRLAEDGHRAAQAALGRMYYIGDYVRPDLNRARALLKPAAEAGLVKAQMTLGEIYFEEAIHKVDHPRATKWFLAAAQAGNPRAQFIVSQYAMPADGMSPYPPPAVAALPKDRRAAIAWLRKAAEQGQPDAQRQLGLRYVLGEGVPEDEDKGYAWIQKGMEQIDPSGARKFHAEEVLEAVFSLSWRILLPWYDEWKLGARFADELEDFAERGYGYLGWYLSYWPMLASSGDSKEEKRRRDLAIQLGAEAGYGPAMARHDLPSDPEDLISPDGWAFRALVSGSAEGAFRIGFWLLMPLGLPDKAYPWLILAARAGHRQARDYVQIPTSDISDAQIVEGSFEASRITAEHGLRLRKLEPAAWCIKHLPFGCR